MGWGTVWAQLICFLQYTCNTAEYLIVHYRFTIPVKCKYFNKFTFPRCKVPIMSAADDSLENFLIRLDISFESSAS